MESLISNDAPGGNTDCGPGALVGALQLHVAESFGSTIVERMVLKSGSSFIGIERLPGMRLGRPKNCYLNAYYAASEAGLFMSRASPPSMAVFP